MANDASLKSPLLNKGCHTSLSDTRQAPWGFYCLPVKYTNAVYWDRLSFWVILLKVKLKIDCMKRFYSTNKTFQYHLQRTPPPQKKKK